MIVFLFCLWEPVKESKRKFEPHQTEVKSEAVIKGDYRKPSGIWKSTAANYWLTEILTTGKQAAGRLAALQASSIIPDSATMENSIQKN